MMPTPRDAAHPLSVSVYQLALCFCLAPAPALHAEEKKLETSPGHFMIWDNFPNEAEARKACHEFARDFRYDPHKYCLAPAMSRDAQAWRIGWLRRHDVYSPNQAFYYGTFYFCPPRHRFVDAGKKCVPETFRAGVDMKRKAP